MPEKKGRAKSPPFHAYPEWTEAKFYAFLRSGLRAKWTRWPPKYEVLAAAKRKYEGPNKRQKFEYQCAVCGGWFPQKEVAVDHIVPVGSLRSLDDLPGFVSRLFVGKESLQVLCDADHQLKTNQERKDRNDQAISHYDQAI